MRQARPVMHVGIANPRWRRKRIWQEAHRPGMEWPQLCREWARITLKRT